MMATAVIFGAGNVGRGLLGQVFSEAGMEVVFIDVSERLITVLDRDRVYLHITVDNESRTQVTVGPVRAVRADDAVAVRDALRDAAVAATCVGARNLPAVCEALAPALCGRIEAGRPPLNLLIAENLHDAKTKVHEWLQAAAPALSDAVLASQVGLVSTSIGCMIPAPREAVTLLGEAAIEVEPYRFLPIDVAAIRGDLPVIPAVVADPGVPFDYYSDRKLFLHNMGHAMSAYLGRLSGDTYVWQAIQRPELRALVRNAMVESASALAAEYGQPVGPLLDHVDDLLHRFANRALADTIERVGRDPRRKLAKGDRVLGAHHLCCSHGIEPRHIRLALAAGLRQLADEEGLTPTEVDSLLAEQGLGRDEREAEPVRDLFEAMADGFDAAALQAVLERRFLVSAIP